MLLQFALSNTCLLSHNCLFISLWAECNNFSKDTEIKSAWNRKCCFNYIKWKGNLREGWYFIFYFDQIKHQVLQRKLLKNLRPHADYIKVFSACNQNEVIDAPSQHQLNLLVYVKHSYSNKTLRSEINVLQVFK